MRTEEMNLEKLEIEIYRELTLLQRRGNEAINKRMEEKLKKKQGEVINIFTSVCKRFGRGEMLQYLS